MSPLSRAFGLVFLLCSLSSCAFERKYGMSEPEWHAAVAAETPEIQNLIRRRAIQTDMTKAQVILSWGLPRRINSTVGRFSEREQWVYGADLSGPYLYFDDGKLTSWQTSR